MSKKIDSGAASRVAYYFRDDDLLSNPCPEFVLEAFSSSCGFDGEHWPAHFLLRASVRSSHIWATFGVSDSKRTANHSQPAVWCFSFNLADLIAARGGVSSPSGAATQCAITFPVKVAENGGFQKVVDHWSQGRGHLQDGAPLELNGHEVVPNQLEFVSAHQNLSYQSAQSSKWRWQYPHSYRQAIARGAGGLERTTIPGLKLTEKKWSGIGVVVPSMQDARKLQYDILSLIDRKIVSKEHFDHILVCDKLPPNIDGLGEKEMQAAFTAACFDFKSCLQVSSRFTEPVNQDFSIRLLILETSTPTRPEKEAGGCWLCFHDNTHFYVRALMKTGRLTVNKQGRYLASLDELDMRRDLRERQEIAQQLARELRETFGVESSYFSVLNSQRPDDYPCYSGEHWEGSY